MKVYSTVINPIPDEEGFHIFECDNCHKTFLLNLHDSLSEQMYCPFCGKIGSIITFTNGIREKVFQDHPINDIKKETEKGMELELDIDEIKTIIENLEDVDVEVLEYSVNEFINTNELVNFEFICCDKIIKVPMDSYEKVKYCSFCKGEILLNICE